MGSASSTVVDMSTYRTTLTVAVEFKAASDDDARVIALDLAEIAGEAVDASTEPSARTAQTIWTEAMEASLAG